MIDLYAGQITDLLLNDARYNPEIQSLAFAFREEKRRIMDEAARTRTMAMIDMLPEKILDVLAAELRTPAYSENYPIETKRTLIKGTLTFYKRLGTPGAVNWVIQAIFGSGHVEEWFEYGGQPYYFRVKIEVPDTGITAEQQAEILRGVLFCKNVRSWLENTDFFKDANAEIYAGAYIGAIDRLDIWPEE